MEAKPGTYVMVLRSRSSSCVEVGRWGLLDIHPGYYLYVGSAFGPGGVRSRVLRHCRESKAKHWHIDYLRELATPVTIWYSHATVHLEHNWAEALNGIKDIMPITGFGCTDCKCATHLFFTLKTPDIDTFSRAVRRKVNSSSCEEVSTYT